MQKAFEKQLTGWHPNDQWDPKGQPISSIATLGKLIDALGKVFGRVMVLVGTHSQFSGKK